MRPTSVHPAFFLLWVRFSAFHRLLLKLTAVVSFCSDAAVDIVAMPKYCDSMMIGCVVFGNRQRRKKTNNSELFAFAGMQTIFAEQKCAVNVIQFANETKDLLAFGCADNTINVCTVVSNPAIIATLKGHVGQITDLDWSISNDYLLSASHDRTARLWQARGGLCARVFNLTQAPWCCRFHPLNNNLFAIGAQSEKGNKGCVIVFNTSTGLPVDSCSTNGAVRSLCFTSNGDHLFAGDDKGFVYTFRFLSNGSLKLLYKNDIGAMPWSLQFKAWYRAGSTQCEPLLLSCCKDSSAKVFRVEGVVASAAALSESGRRSSVKPGSLTLMYTVPVPCAMHLVRAKFCPLLATRDSACIVVGGEDTTVTIHAMFVEPNLSVSGGSTSKDTKKHQKTPSSSGASGNSALVPLWSTPGKPINKLQGHRDTVIDVSWCYDESLLASCDASGTVIVWKRVKTVQVS